MNINIAVGEGEYIHIELPPRLNNAVFRECLTKLTQAAVMMHDEISVSQDVQVVERFPNATKDRNKIVEEIDNARTFNQLTQALNPVVGFINPEQITNDDLRVKFRALVFLKSLVANQRVLIHNNATYIGYSNEYFYIRLKPGEKYVVNILHSYTRNKELRHFESYCDIDPLEFAQILLHQRQLGNLEVIIQRVLNNSSLKYTYSKVNSIDIGLSEIGWDEPREIEN